MSKVADWSKRVIARDGRCMECGEVEGLKATHKVPKTVNPELWLTMDNGMTLCESCYEKGKEKNRPTRLRFDRPHRKILERRIEELENEVRSLKQALRR